ncbi:unnamed protein product [Peniophora sp. CBMAI 1063]|nr:unnamed protein product [Peniophora sp. CBMAI 1063]
MALSAMAAPTETPRDSSATISPGATVEFQLYNSNLCIGTPDVASTVGANMLLTPCGTSRTAFELPSDSQSTQLAFISSSGSTSCVNARNVAVNQAVFLDVCEDDAFERWRIVAGLGLGPIVSNGATDGTFCLSAPSNTEGSPVTFGSCTGGLSQQWTTTPLVAHGN